MFRFYDKKYIGKDELRILKHLIIQQEPAILDLDTKADDFLINLLDFVSIKHVTHVHRIYQFVFKHCSCNEAKRISKRARLGFSFEGQNFVYGEILFPSFASIIKHTRAYLKPGGVFYDLGSGTGRPTIAAALLCDFSICRGIELVPDLLEQAEVTLLRYQDRVVNNYTIDDYYLSNRRAQSIEFLLGDMLELDWLDADVCFANSTCFDHELMQRLSIKAEGLRPGSVFITLTKGLMSSEFELVMKNQYQMSWGDATVYVQIRKQRSQEAEAALLADSSSEELPPPASDSDT